MKTEMRKAGDSDFGETDRPRKQDPGRRERKELWGSGWEAALQTFI